jgi:hypothetical protein
VFLVVLVMLGIAGFVAWRGGLVSDNAVASVTNAVKDAFQNGDERPTPPPPQAPVATQPEPEPEQELPYRKPSPLPELAPSVTAAPEAPSASLQDLWVDTNPPGAKVVLDDRLDQSCQTPCMLHSASGVHHITVSRAGYQNEYREIQVGSVAQDVPLITLRLPGTTLMVNSDPPGANIRIDGQVQDRQTPASISLKPGTYLVTVEKGGRTQSQRVEIRDSPVFLRLPLGP